MRCGRESRGGDGGAAVPAHVPQPWDTNARCDAPKPHLAGEVELIDAGDMDGASTRTAKENRYLESNRLDDKDIEDLGYGPPDGG